MPPDATAGAEKQVKLACEGSLALGAASIASNLGLALPLACLPCHTQHVKSYAKRMHAIRSMQSVRTATASFCMLQQGNRCSRVADDCNSAAAAATVSAAHAYT